ncbi:MULTISPECIES: DUF4232 domain-containing protein [Streptomyces]|uniref:DUF4232 domain-containing protein n=1 Tax=Streptomyces TaxID=1883 RepID=UPI000C2720D7|nr:DUF4232 domain-containing protein [Streptomyces sp. CB01201]MBX7471340.1 DUF4232 domain-containing protein [Streptomyces sp. MAG02]PJN03955.1 hypothetical protein CG740_06145 [Streptomyces sp. CB01201]
MRVRKLTFAALAVAAGLSLTACQSDDGSPAPSDSAASNAASSGGGSSSAGANASTGSGTGSDQGSGKGTGGTGGKGTSAGTGSSGSGGSAKGAAKCRTNDLNITASDSTIDGDENRSVAVGFKNTSGHDCMVSGFAGVDLKTNYGNISAKRTGEPATPYTLKTGKSVYFTLSYPANNTGGSGIRVTGLLVTPPGETKSASLPWPGAASLPITENGATPVKVGPIGSAGQGGAS